VRFVKKGVTTTIHVSVVLQKPVLRLKNAGNAPSRTALRKKKFIIASSALNFPAKKSRRTANATAGTRHQL
jgi:hypothetical protein